jgi:hypothetical protein
MPYKCHIYVKVYFELLKPREPQEALRFTLASFNIDWESSSSPAGYPVQVPPPQSQTWSVMRPQGQLRIVFLKLIHFIPSKSKAMLTPLISQRKQGTKANQPERMPEKLLYQAH